MTAVVLAGGGAGDRLARGAGVAAKALVPFGGKPLGMYVLEALAASSVVRSCVYVGPGGRGLEPAPFPHRFVPAGDSLADSLASGLGAATANSAWRLLVVTADLPWLTGAAVADFVTHAPEAALVYPIVSRQSAIEQFPGQKRTFVSLREGSFTGGNLILVEPWAVPALLPLADRAYRARKNPLALATLLGPRILAGFLTRRLRLADVEDRVSRLIGAPAKVYQSAHACLGADADKAEHLAMAPRAGS